MSTIERICVVSDWMSGAPDEGIHNLARNLAERWAAAHAVRVIRVGTDIRVNRLFASPALRSALREAAPDAIVYLSSSCARLAALVRARALKRYAPRSRVFVVAVQPARLGALGRRLAALAAPDGIFVQSPAAARELEGLPCPVRFLPSGVDMERFTPAGLEEKRSLRIRHGIDAGAFVVLHVGHVTESRNVALLGDVARSGDATALLVGSTSTRQDETIARRLEEAGVRLIREYLPAIEEIYRLADLYVFPVVSEGAAIGVPLSVLEAMACNLPVMTTPFGGLPLMFKEEGGLFYLDGRERLVPQLARARRGTGTATRRMVEPYDWEKVATLALDMMEREDRA